MIPLVKRHKISLALLILSSIMGVVLYLKESPIDMWLIEYEFDTEVESELPDFTKADTVFQYNDIFCRNFTASVGDTLVEKGIRRYELKLYLPQTSGLNEVDVSNEILVPPQIRIVKRQFRETQKNKQKLLYWVLFGLFLGMVAEFVIALKKKPSSN